MFLAAKVCVAAAKPNFLIILVDDLGYADTGFNGSREIETPNLDRLAGDGVVFENGYVTHAYCGPSRAGLLTGRHQARFGLEINPSYSPYDLHMGLPLTERTFAERLQGAGYRTGAIGKWHMGAAPPYHPNNRGFEYFYGFLSGGHTYFPSKVNTTRDLLLENGKPHYSANEGGYLPLIRNNNAAEFDEYLTTALSRDAARFIEESDRPFCLYLAYNAPHGPMEAPRETFEKYRHIGDWFRATYAAMVDELDRGVGMVVEALERSGKLDNTLIFFLSDNGGVQPKKGHENENWARNHPFRGGKGSMLEGGCHVPFFLHWPDGIAEPGRFEGLVSALDIAATAVALGGGDTSGPEIEGVNLAPYVSGEKTGSPHEALYWRVRDGVAWAVRTPTGKLLKRARGGTGVEMYDMANDPYETTNIADQNPAMRAELAALWNAWNSKNTATVLLEAPNYQVRRLRMYDELHEQLLEQASRTQPVFAE